jgi:hypothetical protein
VRKRNLFDYYEEWKELVSKANKDINSLSEEEKIWYRVQILIGDAVNGGLISHYYNSGANYMNETLQSLDYLGHSNISQILKELNKLFPGGRPPQDFEARNEIISNWPDGQFDEILEELDQKFYDKKPELEKTLTGFIESKTFKNKDYTQQWRAFIGFFRKY